MLNSMIVSTALLAASAVAQNVGSAIVVNKCTYDVHLSNVPASGNGFETVSDLLSPDDTYTQGWTSLTNGGWSIKLSRSGSFGDDILQYEYAFFNDGIIWYDLSAVNGNPWDGNWEVSADDIDSCAPRQAAYRYATDDAYGMQSCPSNATITVVLCSGEEQADEVVASISNSGAAAAPSATPAALTYSAQNNQVSVADDMVAETTTAVSPTTFATSVITPAPNNVQTVVETAVVTQVYTTYRHRHDHDRRHL